MPAANARFGATAAGSAELKCVAKIRRCRQAAIPLAVTREAVRARLILEVAPDTN